ncbi:MAG: peptide deformylase [Oscillospiraceae bacterium]|nr:peptide deformylase [Oscillospiraceae bacterium]
MAKRIFLPGDDPALRKKSREVTVFDGKLHQLLDDMYDTMTAAEGVGLAAVQIGILRRAVIIDIDKRIELINPVIAEESEEMITASEGCLSFPKESGLVPRPKKVIVTAQDRHGDPITVTGEELLARALCHEIDHLEGIVYQDKAVEMHKPEEDE